MNDIQSCNHKYSTINSLLTNNGNVNSAITRRDWFTQLDIYQQILDKSSDLNIFPDVKLNERILYIANNMQINNCPICNEKYIYFPKSQKMYRKCNHKFNTNTEKNSILRKELWSNKLQELLTLLNDKTYILSADIFDKLVNEYFSKPDNYNFLITNKSIEFFHDLILRTLNILPIVDNKLEISQRLYIIKHNLQSIPTCTYCNKNVSFRGRNYGYSEVCKEHLTLLSSKNKCINSINKLQESINIDKYDIVKLPEKMSSDSLIIKCKNCGKESDWIVKDGMLADIHYKHLCRSCETNHSVAEESVLSFIQSIYNNEIVYKLGSRKIIPPYELDIYLPDKKLAIEFDGLYWHSADKVSRSYHLNKTKLCEEQNIQLIHIFEDEWLYNTNIVKNRLCNLLGIYSKVIYARKCEVREVPNKLAKEMLNRNHIQGNVNAVINLGLYYEDELVSIMTFGKSRYNKKYEWELLRFCNEGIYHVIGGASKLLKYFERTFKPKSLLSYADRRWSKGNLYSKLGFELIGSSAPNYWYFRKNVRESRINYQKHKLKDKLPIFSEELSEYENMKNNGYNRIYDCGNLVFIKQYK
jgi:very-short-patch-repair endonuclease